MPLPNKLPTYLKSNSHTQHYTLTNAGNKKNTHENTPSPHGSYHDHATQQDAHAWVNYVHTLCIHKEQHKNKMAHFYLLSTYNLHSHMTNSQTKPLKPNKSITTPLCFNNKRTRMATLTNIFSVV